MKIAEALLLRKQLEQKVAQLTPVKEQGTRGLFELRTTRVNVSADTDEISFAIPRITIADITQEYDYFAAELRKLDASIQKANWQYDVDYKQDKKPEDKVLPASTKAKKK